LKGIQPNEYLDDFGIGDTPVQPCFFELLTPRSVLDAHQLHCATAHAHIVALAVASGAFLQVVAGQKFGLAVERPRRFGRYLVDVVPDLIDLTRHLTQHFGVLVFDTQLKGFGAGTHSSYHRLCDAENNRPYRPVRSNLGLNPEACREDSGQALLCKC
jgi:hypothetical protein